MSLLLFTSPRGTETAMREREEEENQRGVDTEGGGEIARRGGGRVSYKKRPDRKENHEVHCVMMLLMNLGKK